LRKGRNKIEREKGKRKLRWRTEGETGKNLLKEIDGAKMLSSMQKCV